MNSRIKVTFADTIDADSFITTMLLGDNYNFSVARGACDVVTVVYENNTMADNRHAVRFMQEDCAANRIHAIDWQIL